MFLRVRKRWFVFAFGYGRAMLDQDKVEPRFGLRVTLNAVNPDELHSIDAKRFEGAKFQIRRQAAGKTSLDVFGLDVRQDIVNAVYGRPRSDLNLGSSLGGRDSLRISTDRKVTELPDLCGKLLEIYNSEDYKERFGWIDHLQPVRDPKKVDELNDALVRRLNSHDTERIDLAIPDMVDPDRISGFKYGTDTLQPDLDLEALLSRLNQTRKQSQALTLDLLRKRRISYFYESDDAASGSWSVYKCLVAEIEEQRERRLYVLTEGEWFEVHADLVSEVGNYLKSLPACHLPFPESEVTMREDEYNEWASQILPDTILQDRKLVHVGGAHGKVEPCDLLTKKRHIIHVKRKHSSATLSHLYAQAQVSAELLRSDAQFRELWRQQIANDNPAFSNVIQTSFQRGQYEVVLVILTDKAEDIPLHLPFFARLQLQLTAQHLQDIGYKVSVTGAACRSK